jgi:DNA-binding ferritin-like protein (Dps family)
MLQELKLRKIRLESQKKLNSNYMRLYKNMSAYIKNSSLSGYEKEIIIQEILDILLESQFNNKELSEINKIIGNDYETFCQSMINEYNSDKSVAYIALKYFSRGMAISLLFILAMAIVNGFSQFSLMPTLDLRDIIFCFIWGFLFIPYALKRCRRLPNLYNSKDMKILLATGVLILASTEIVKRCFGGTVLNFEINLLNGFPYILGGVCMIAIFEIVERMHEAKVGKGRLGL